MNNEVTHWIGAEIDSLKAERDRLCARQATIEQKLLKLMDERDDLSRKMNMTAKRAAEIKAQLNEWLAEQE